MECPLYEPVIAENVHTNFQFIYFITAENEQQVFHKIDFLKLTNFYSIDFLIKYANKYVVRLKIKMFPLV